MERSQPLLSTRIGDLVASPIRDILSVIDRPGMVSFAGGLPAPEAFPDLGAIKVPREQLQYGPTEGDPALRAHLADELRARGLRCGPDQVLVLSGSQQGIDLVAKLFIDEATPVAVESPTYLAALQVFRFFGASLGAFSPDDPERLREALEGRAFAYAIPNFQNPTGRCYGPEARANLADACDSTTTPLFEDDPYRDLAYDTCDTTPICARLERAPWIYQGSFSKSLAPGLRLGYLAASPELVPHLVRLKQAADLHSSRLSQWIVLEKLRDAGRKARIETLVARYRTKRDVFDGALRHHFSEIATWERPPGGLFFWLSLRGGVPIDTRRLLAPAIERGVAFMPGEPFFPVPVERAHAMRLNFSHAAPADVHRGLRTLAELVKGALER